MHRTAGGEVKRALKLTSDPRYLRPLIRTLLLLGAIFAMGSTMPDQCGNVCFPNIRGLALAGCPADPRTEHFFQPDTAYRHLQCCAVAPAVHGLRLRQPEPEFRQAHCRITVDWSEGTDVVHVCSRCTFERFLVDSDSRP